VRQVSGWRLSRPRLRSDPEAAAKTPRSATKLRPAWSATSGAALLHGRLSTDRRLPLGEQDTPDRLLIPQNCTGESGDRYLARRVRPVITSGQPELVLLSGYSGIGKFRVVNELHKALVRRAACSPRASSISTKRDIRTPPWASLSRALSARS